MTPRIHTLAFGQLSTGRPVAAHVLDNGHGLRLTVLELGALVQSLQVPDATGRSTDIVLGFDALDDYEQRNPAFGVVVGRYANRIRHGRFTLDGVEHRLPANDGPHCLHGGTIGFGARCWETAFAGLDDGGRPTLRLHLHSADGDQGFPGHLEARATYQLEGAAVVRLTLEARTDRATVVNLTHHSYFNLAGHGSARGHELTLAASRMLQVDAAQLPTQAVPVAGTPFDFRTPARVDARGLAAFGAPTHRRGFDNHWILDEPVQGDTLRFAARLRDPVSGRAMDHWTSAPGLQFYDGNHFDGRLIGRGGLAVPLGAGLCLEPQHCPDSPNHPEWPSTVLRPGAVWRSVTEFRFN